MTSPFGHLLCRLCLALLLCAPAFCSRPKPPCRTVRGCRPPQPNSRLSPANTPTRTSPTRRSASTSQDGKLIVETERACPDRAQDPLRARIRISQLEKHLPLHARRLRPRRKRCSFHEARRSSIAAPARPFITSFTTTSALKSMIPMRDGVKLHAVILKPADIAAPLPFLIQRTPYGVDGTSRASFFRPARSWRATATSMLARTFAAATRARASSS